MGEARRAFAHNVDVYTEEGALWSGAALGVANMARYKLQVTSYKLQATSY